MMTRSQRLRIRRLLDELRLAAWNQDWGTKLIWEAEDALDHKKPKLTEDEAADLIERLRDNCNWVPRLGYIGRW